MWPMGLLFIICVWDIYISRIKTLLIDTSFAMLHVLHTDPNWNEGSEFRVSLSVRITIAE